MAHKQRAVSESQPKDSKSIPVSWSTCNCTSFWLPEGVVRTLLVRMYPQFKDLSKQPCTHQQYGVIDLASNNSEANTDVTNPPQNPTIIGDTK